MLRIFVICISISLGGSGAAYAQAESGAVDISLWQCKWCPAAGTEIESSVKGGAAYVTNDSFKYGDYTGLNQAGAYILADAEARGRSEGGTYFEVQARDLGLDSNHLGVEGGDQGRTRFAVSYDQLPKLREDSSRTPYTGDSSQSLPSGWVAAPTTGGMTALQGALHDVDIFTQRRTTSFAASYHQNESLTYNLGYQRETKKGRRDAGLGFGSFRSAILAIPVDYVSDNASIGLSYLARRWQLSADYRLSAFKNQHDSVRWDNAFDTPAGVTEGKAALEPDNTMQALSLNGFFRATDAISFSALMSYGRMRQDQDFLPYTINSGIVTSALPRNSLDGSITTLDASLNMNADILDNMILAIQYRQQGQDNSTARAGYDYVVADTSVAGVTRFNMPYSFHKKELEAHWQYLFSARHKLAAGAGYQVYDRTYQDIETTTESGLWAQYRTRLSSLGLEVRLDYSNRDGSAYDPEPGVSAQNTLMRKYYMADRVRTGAGLALSYALAGSADLGLDASLTQDDYANSDIGLQESNEANLSLDLRFTITDSLSLRGLYALTRVDSVQTGSTSFSTPDWKGKNDDRVDVFDAGILYQMLSDQLGIGLDYTYTRSTGRITVAGGALPELNSERQTVRLFSDYRLSNSALVNIALIHEKYQEDNWARDGVSTNTINNVLTLGEVSPYYDIGYVMASFELHF